MKMTYDPDGDVLLIRWGDPPVEESDEVAPGVILDYDAAGAVLGVEILNASKKIENLATEEALPGNLLPQIAAAA